jgi:glycosyltransferase involved in cell wall biosynthesis
MPAWNEAAALGSLLAELRTRPGALLERVVVVDAHSTDATVPVALAGGAQVVTQQRRGYGAACWEGYQVARRAGATVVVFLDADGSDPPDAIPGLVRPILDGRADLVLGARRAPPGQPDPVPWHARAGNRLVCALLWVRTGRRVSDLPSLKAITAARLDELQLEEMGYGWTTEMVAKALRRGLRVREVPVVTRPRAGGVSKVSGNLAASVRAGVSLIRTALRQ